MSTVTKLNCAPSITIPFSGTQNPQGTASSSTVSPASVNGTVTQTPTSFSYGNGANQAVYNVVQQRTLAASGTETLDLYGSSTPLTDIFGNNCLMRHIMLLSIWIISEGSVTGTSGTGLIVGNAGSNPFLGPMGGTTPTQAVYLNGPPLMWGEPTVGFVVSTSHGQLLVTNNDSSNAITYQLVIEAQST